MNYVWNTLYVLAFAANVALAFNGGPVAPFNAFVALLMGGVLVCFMQEHTA